MYISGYAAKVEKGPLVPYSYKISGLRPMEIEIDIEYCSVGHGDADFVDNHWGESKYPMLPGHELIGRVNKRGSDVTLIAPGDRVGVAYQVHSCMECEYCIQGQENYCQKQQLLCFHKHGGFADKIIVDHRFAFKIPELLSPAHTTPLLCSGATVYSAIKNYEVLPSMKVGVVGIGGLGHLAIQLLALWGCEVTAFSHSPHKEKFVKRLGAHHFILNTDEDRMRGIKGKYDFILSTGIGDLEWIEYIKALRPKGKLCFVGLPFNNISFPIPFLADFSQKSVCGSYISNRAEVNEILTLAVRHNIQSYVEIMPMSQVNEALERVRAGQVLGRIVLEN